MSLVQDMVIVDVMKSQNNYIVHLTDIIITTSIIIVNLCISNTTYIAVNYITFWIIFINKWSSDIIAKRNVWIAIILCWRNIVTLILIFILWKHYWAVDWLALHLKVELTNYFLKLWGLMWTKFNVFFLLCWQS